MGNLLLYTYHLNSLQKLSFKDYNALSNVNHSEEEDREGGGHEWQSFKQKDDSTRYYDHGPSNE